MKYILQQSEDSLIFKFFHLQLQSPTKGDWALTCLSDLKNLEISESLEEIKHMTKHKFKNLLKSRIAVNAMKYLLDVIFCVENIFKYVNLMFRSQFTPVWELISKSNYYLRR